MSRPCWRPSHATCGTGFGERFRILRAGSGPEALEVIRELRARGDVVALLVADQRMPGMAGTDYLVEARKLVPAAKRVLLTAYADTEAAIAVIDEVALDYLEEGRLPVVLLEDGTVLERPTVLEFAERLGVAVGPAQDHCGCRPRPSARSRWWRPTTSGGSCSRS